MLVKLINKLVKSSFETIARTIEGRLNLDRLWLLLKLLQFHDLSLILDSEMVIVQKREFFCGLVLLI